MSDDFSREDGNGYGTAAFILGVVSFFLFACCVNYITAILAIILAIVQMVKNRKKALAVAAIILACLSILLGTLMWVGVYKNRDYINFDEITEYYEDQI